MVNPETNILSMGGGSNEIVYVKGQSISKNKEVVL